jgi:hypothetical protein
MGQIAVSAKPNKTAEKKKRGLNYKVVFQVNVVGG